MTPTAPPFAGQLEHLRPHQIRQRLAERSLVYVPLGTIEWHAEHLPVGLDALTAHGVCLQAAARTGGLVYPPLHFGIGGGHGNYPWTVMLGDASLLRTLLESVLAALQSFGVQQVVLFTGHFADEQIQLINEVAAKWNAWGQSMQVQACSMNQIAPSPIAPDHAGIFETTLLHALWPEGVDLSQLPAKLQKTGNIEEDGWGPQRHIAGHPLWGVVGPDPRDFKAEQGPVLLEAATRWLVEQIGP